MSSELNTAWETRLERLERNQRIQRRAAGAIAVALSAALLLGAGGTPQDETPPTAAPVVDVLRARRIDIVDASDRVTCTLTTELQGPAPGGGLLVLRNRVGTSVCRLGSFQDHGALSLHTASGPTACAVGVVGDGGSLDLFGLPEDAVVRLRAEGEAGELTLIRDAETGVVLTSDAFGDLGTRAVESE